MQRSFPETLSALRRDKNISQRKAAADLNIRLSAVQDGQAEHRFQHRSGGESLS